MHEVISGKWYSEVSISEVLRYSGVRSAEYCGDPILSEAVKAVEQVGEAAVPKSISGECTLTVSGNTCTIDGIEIVSRSLAGHLSGCDRALLFAATLGSGVDLLIGRYSAVRMSYAVLLQGAAAALIELFCDSECAALESRYQAEEWFLLPRFSPGYGDFPLDCQQVLNGHLNAYKYAGIAVSGGGQMTPMKSVSAVIGISRTRRSSHGSCASGKCARCPNTGCIFRRT